MEELNDLIDGLPGAEIISAGMKEKALQDSRIPDSNGNLPGEENYVPTYDPYYAAYLLVGLLYAQPTVTSASSEGTSVTATPFNWDGFGAWLKARSPILSQSDAFTILSIPGEPKVVRTNMDTGGYYDNRDADLN